MNIAGDIYTKTEEVLFTDKIKYSNKLNELLSNEIFYILKQYFEMKENSFHSKIYTERNGEVNVNLSFKARRILIKREADVI